MSRFGNVSIALIPQATVPDDTNVKAGANAQQEAAAPADPVVPTEEQPVEEKYEIPMFQLQDSTSKSRFSGADWIDAIKCESATIIGAGGIGSHTILNLARTGIGNLFVYDGDRIESQNMAGQLYRLKDIGLYKVDALWSICKEYVPTVSGGFYKEYYSGQPLTMITITALDSMKARKLVWESYKSQFGGDKATNRCLFIDGRMTADAFQVFVVRMSNKEQVSMYEKYNLFDDSIASPLPCSYKATHFIGATIGGFITAIVKEHLHFVTDEMFCNNVKFYNEFDSSLGVKVSQLKTKKLVDESRN